MRERWESGEEFEGGAREELKGVERVKERRKLWKDVGKKIRGSKRVPHQGVPKMVED